METATLTVLLTKAAILALFVERAVAQVKAISKADLFGSAGPARPWPLVSLSTSGIVVYVWGLYIVNALIGHGPTEAPVLGWFFDWAISTLTIAGGSAGIIDLIKGVTRVRSQATAASNGR